MDSREGNNLNNKSFKLHKKEAESFKFIQALSREEKLILIKASKGNGTVIKRIIGATGDIEIIINGENIVDSDTLIGKKQWGKALQKLLLNALLEEVGERVFEITDEGIQIADILDKRN